MKIQKIIAHLDVYALNRLRKWLRSPAHNEQTKLADLLEVFITHKNENTEHKTSKNKAIENNTTENKATDVRERSLLLKKIEDWFVYEQQQTDLVSEKMYLAEYYQKNDLRDFALETICDAQKTHQKADYYNADWHLQQYELLYFEEKENAEITRQTGKTHVLALGEHLDIAYYCQRLTLFANLLTYKNVLQADLDASEIQPFLAFLATTKAVENPLVALHFYLVQTMIAPDDETHFEKLVTLLHAHYQLLSPVEQRDRYTGALNYCVRRINIGDLSYFKKLFTLYQTLLTNGVLLDKGILGAWDYKNIITVGLRVEEYDWVERFLYDFNEKLPDSLRQNALTYNLAKLNFAKENYKKVIELLRDVSYQDMVYTLDSRATLIKTYYLLNEFDALEAAIESFRIFLLRNQTIATTVKKQYQNFLRLVKKLLRLSLQDKKGIADLRTKIETTPLLADKKWLLSQTEHT